MKPNRQLMRAISAMKDGSRNGLIIFYNKTFHYTFLQVSRLYRDSEERNLFLVHFYVYLLLHISEYDSTDDLHAWISAQIPRFYESHTGERYSPVLKLLNQSIPDDATITAAASVVWSRLSVEIDFPAEKRQKTFSLLPLCCLLAASVLVVFIILLAQENGFMLFTKSSEPATESSYSPSQSIESLDSEIEAILGNEEVTVTYINHSTESETEVTANSASESMTNDSASSESEPTTSVTEIQ